MCIMSKVVMMMMMTMMIIIINGYGREMCFFFIDKEERCVWSLPLYGISFGSNYNFVSVLHYDALNMLRNFRYYILLKVNGSSVVKLVITYQGVLNSCYASFSKFMFL